MDSSPAEAIDESFVPIPSPAVQAVPVGNEAVLLDEATGRLHALDPLATLIWTCFDGEATLGEIGRDLVEGLDAPSDEVRHSLLTLTKQLGDEGALANVDPPAPPPEPGYQVISDDTPQDPRYVIEPPSV